MSGGNFPFEEIRTPGVSAFIGKNWKEVSRSVFSLFFFAFSFFSKAAFDARAHRGSKHRLLARGSQKRTTSGFHSAGSFTFILFRSPCISWAACWPSSSAILSSRWGINEPLHSRFRGRGSFYRRRAENPVFLRQFFVFLVAAATKRMQRYARIRLEKLFANWYSWCLVWTSSVIAVRGIFLGGIRNGERIDTVVVERHFIRSFECLKLHWVDTSMLQIKNAFVFWYICSTYCSKI